MSNTFSERIAFFVQWREKKSKIACFVLRVIKSAEALRRGLAVGRSCFCGRSSTVVGRARSSTVVGFGRRASSVFRGRRRVVRRRWGPAGRRSVVFCSWGEVCRFLC